MTLLDLTVKEYIAIVDFLKENESIINNRIIIDKIYFKALLEKNLYMKFRQKVKLYKTLNFIIFDKSSNTYTMPHKDILLKKTVRKVIINYNTYMIVKELFNTSI